jgi:hypothetical protein
MALDDYMEPEVAVVVAVTAAVASPPVRKALRKGAVYGLAGLLIARDKLAALATNVSQGARRAAGAAENAPPPAPAPAAPATQAAPG